MLYKQTTFLTHPDLLFADLIIKTASVMATTNTFRKELVNLQSNL